MELQSDLRRYEALLQMTDLMVRYHTLPELFRGLAPRLRDVIEFDLANFSLHDPARRVMKFHLWAGERLEAVPAELPIDDSPSGWVWKKQQLLLIPDLRREKRFDQIREAFLGKGIRSYCVLPLTTVQSRMGALGLGHAKPDAFDEADVQLLSRVAELVSLAMEAALARHALEHEKQRLHALVEITRNISSSLDLRTLFPAIAGCVNQVVPHDFAGITMYDSGREGVRSYVLGSAGNPAILAEGALVPFEHSAGRGGFPPDKAVELTHKELVASKSGLASRMVEEGIRSLLCIPLATSSGVIGSLNIGSKEHKAFAQLDRSLLHQVAAQVAIALDNARAYREIAELKDRLAEEKLYLEDEIRSELNFEEIIGESEPLKRVLTQAKTVATSDATVLILGETGTGKELLARAIHRMSSRRDASFIKLNCAAIPTGLLESELFGHEKGAFTGALAQKIGRMELADGGSLFLDEVGDIPLELQPKMLRVLQDREFERLGSTRTLKVNIRLIAATNQDLAKSVAEREFRSDLYYRLKVFPIVLPPLRERAADIPILVRYFVQKFARRMDKPIETIPSETMDALVSWHWPGNIRELENFMERSVILTPASVLKVPLAELASDNPAANDGTLESVERDHIIRALRESGGQIAGPRGAAARLGIKRTTLQSRIHRMGIDPDEFRG